MKELSMYIGAAVVVYLALLLHPLGKAHPVQALLVAVAWPIGGVLIACYHIFLLLSGRDGDLPGVQDPPPPSAAWGRRKR